MFDREQNNGWERALRAYARGDIRSQADLDDVLGKGDPEVFIEYGPDGPRRVRVKVDGMQPDPRTG